MTEQTKKYKKLKHYNTPGHAHELTFSCYHRYDYFNNALASEFFLSELQQSRMEHHFQIWAYVLMTNHIHLLIWPLNEKYNIARILNDTKGRMAKKYRDYILKNKPESFNSFLIFDKSKKRKIFRFWQPGGGFDRNLWNAKAIHHSIKYIEANPVRKKMAPVPEKYRWSSAYSRVHNDGVIPDKFNIPVVMPNSKHQRTGAV